MNAAQIEAIRSMIAEGLTDRDIADAISQADAETREAEDFERNAYGLPDDDRCSRDAIMADRFDMGRNDAGEWLGFM
jgi:hypothetical protein